MDEQKRLIIAIVLSVVVLVVFQWLFVKPPDPNQQPKQAQNQTQEQARPEQAKSNVTDYKPATAPAPATAAAPEQKVFRKISVATPLYDMVLSENGASVVSMKLKKYKETNKENSPQKQLISEQLTSGTLLCELEGQTVPGLANAVFTADLQENRATVNAGEKSIAFTYNSPQNIVVKKIYTFNADNYTIECQVVIQNGSGMPVNDALVISTPGFYNDEIKKKSRFAYIGPIGLIEDKYTTIKPAKISEKDTYHGKIDWSGFTQRYFMTVVMPDAQKGNSPKDARIKLSFKDDVVRTSYVQKMDRIDPGQQGLYAYTVYMGPKSLRVLSKFNNSMKDAINFGFFHILAKPLLIGMNFIHDVIPNYGVAILLLTIIIKLLFWPLGTKSYKSMNEMKKVQPLMMELREKYKDDRQRMNQEIMGLYKTYKVNPASGCLPILVQMPIFFALYRMLYQAIELRHAPFFGWVTDLSAPDRLFHFNFAIPMMQEPYGIPLLTLIMGASFFLQQKMAPTAGDPMQQKMMMLMPIFMTVLFINFPAGLVLYMFANNLISMGQQYYIQKKFS